MAKDHQSPQSPNPKGSQMPFVDTAFDPVAAALQQLHQSVASEELPADFLRILDDIDAKLAAATRAAKP